MSEAHKTLKARIERASLGVILGSGQREPTPPALNKALHKVLDRAYRDGLILSPPTYFPSGNVQVSLRPDEVGKIDITVKFI